MYPHPSTIMLAAEESEKRALSCVVFAMLPALLLSTGSTHLNPQSPTTVATMKSVGADKSAEIRLICLL
jgi:hypothetical protein